ncbi:MAG: PIN domain-containing protein [Burkholderiales bacterium]
MAFHRRALILDANILIRAVLGPRVRNLIVENMGRVQFFTPVQCIDDARKYLPSILQAKGVDPGPAMEVLDLILKEIQSLEDEWLEDYEATAKSRLEKRDLNDWPVLAAAPALSCPIWMQDTDFFGVGVATWTTEHISEYF